MRAHGTGAGTLSPHSTLQRPPVEWPGGLHQHSKALLVSHTFSAWGLCWSCACPCTSSTSPHPHITGQDTGRWDPQPLTPWAPRSLTTTPQRELGASPAGGFAPGSCQDLLSIRESLSLKLSPVNTHLVLTWLCCPGKFQLLFILCFYPFG